MHFSKKILAILFLGVSECFETGAIIGSFFDLFPVFGSGQSKKKNLVEKKKFVPILSVWPRKSFETLAIIVIFRKKKQRKKKGAKKKAAQKKKKSEKKISECAFPLFTCRAVILLVF